MVAMRLRVFCGETRVICVRHGSASQRPVIIFSHLLDEIREWIQSIAKLADDTSDDLDSLGRVLLGDRGRRTLSRRDGLIRSIYPDLAQCSNSQFLDGAV